MDGSTDRLASLISSLQDNKGRVTLCGLRATLSDERCNQIIFLYLCYAKNGSGYRDYCVTFSICRDTYELQSIATTFPEGLCYLVASAFLSSNVLEYPLVLVEIALHIEQAAAPVQGKLRLVPCS